MTKVKFALFSMSYRLLCSSVNHTLIHENFELFVFKNIKFIDEIWYNWPNDLLGTNLYKMLNLVDNHCWQCNNVVIFIK